MIIIFSQYCPNAGKSGKTIHCLMQETVYIVNVLKFPSHFFLLRGGVNIFLLVSIVSNKNDDGNFTWQSLSVCL